MRRFVGRTRKESVSRVPSYLVSLLLNRYDWKGREKKKKSVSSFFGTKHPCWQLSLTSGCLIAWPEFYASHLLFHITPLLYFYIKTKQKRWPWFICSYICTSVTAAWNWKGQKLIHCMFWINSLAEEKEFSPLRSCLWFHKLQPPDAIVTLLIHQLGGGGDEGCSGSLDRQHLKSDRQEERGRVRGGEKEWLANLKKAGGGRRGVSPFIGDIKDFGGRRSQKTSAV